MRSGSSGDFEAERFFDAGDKVAVFVRTFGTARQSGAPVEIRVAHVSTLKEGGWRTYGVFKNQWDCVSFVATRGPEPAGESLSLRAHPNRPEGLLAVLV